MARRQTYRQQYQKEISRIKRRIRNIEKRGYEFELPSELQLPEKVTKRKLERLKEQYGIKNIYQYASYTTDTGKRISGGEARKLERSRAAKKGVQTRTERKYYAEEDTGEYLPRDTDVRQAFYDEDEYGVEAGTGEEPSQVDTALRTIQEILSQLEQFDTSNLTPSTAWDSKHVNPRLVIRKYNLVMELKERINNIIDSATPQELKIIANNIENNSDEIKEIVDRLMYKLYKTQESTIEYEAAPDLKRLADIIRKG